MNLNRKRDGYGHDFSKWYQRHNRKHVTQDPKKVFHSFRHLVADTLKQKGVAEGIIAEILGHANHSITTGRYGKRYRPSVLLEALEQLNYGV
jgi:integrase